MTTKTQSENTFSAFKVEYMQPFVDSLRALFVDHLGGSLTVGKPEINPEGKPKYEMSGAIAFSGTVKGQVVVSFPLAVAQGAVEAYLKMSPVPDDVIEDCVGELTNIVVGRAKSELESHQIAISPPIVVRGTDFQITPQKGAVCLSMPCECQYGSLRVEMSFLQAAPQ